LLGCLIFLVTISTWYAPMLLRHGYSFIDEFFIQHHFQRFLTNKYKHPQPFYFFPMVALLGCLPWMPYLLRSIYLNCKDWREVLQFRSQPLVLFLWIWVITIIGFFSISSSKLTGYILPVFPAIALLIGHQFNQWWEHPPRSVWRWIITGLCVLMLTGAGWLAIHSSGFNYSNSLVVLQVSAALVLTAVICFSLLVVQNERGATLAMPFGLALVLIMALRAFHPLVEFKQTTAEIAVKAREAAVPNERLVFYINNHHSIDYYAPDMPLRDGHSELITLMKPEEVSALIEKQPTKSILVISPTRWISQIEAIMSAEKLWTRDRWVLVRVKNK
jgi:4-amino-4-deoxy-L-arabinose transferase-like glycosyltransferase